MYTKHIFFFSLLLLVLLGWGLYLMQHRSSGTDVPVNFQPQQMRQFSIDPAKITRLSVPATAVPQFLMRLTNSEYSDFWTAHAQEKDKVVEANVVQVKNGTEVPVKTAVEEKNKQLVITPQTTNAIKPGLYKLNVKVKTLQGIEKTITQDFTWGVLALNTDKGKYRVGERVTIGMAVLDDNGSTKCFAKGTINFNTAKIWLTITSPKGVVTKFSTDEETIKGTATCVDKGVTNNPDFITDFVANETGKYSVHMEAETINGKRSTDDTFLVGNTDYPFTIERREYPTRIYPRADYPVKIVVTANQDYRGKVRDFVPKSFQIVKISDGGNADKSARYQDITWNVNWQKGNEYELTYTIMFPKVAPEFYLVGPLTIGSFSEGREWQIASDALFTFVQEKHNTANSGTSVSVTLDSAPTQNNLVVVICFRTTNSTFNTPTGFTLAYNNSNTSPRSYMFYRVVPAGMSSTISCTTGSSGVIGIQAIEFSGNATSSVRDTRNRRNGVSCNGSLASASLTPNNPDVLIVSSYAGTTTRTVSAHSNGFVDSSATGSFSGSSGFFDSSYKEAINNPPISNTTTATLSGNGTNCGNLIVGFNSQISVAQGSFRFFNNADSTTPGTPLAAQNTNITLTAPNYPFRLRMLVDVDSPSGNTIGALSGDFALTYTELPNSGNCVDGTLNFVDVEANGGAIAYNPNPSSGGNNVTIVSSGNDPSDSGNGYTTVLENYIETWLDDGTENVTNNAALANNQAGLWDFSLIENALVGGQKTYCILLTDGGGVLLDAYRNIPRVTTYLNDVLIRSGSTVRSGSTIQ